jgi:hypothetical protein
MHSLTEVNIETCRHLAADLLAARQRYTAIAI